MPSNAARLPLLTSAAASRAAINSFLSTGTSSRSRAPARRAFLKSAGAGLTATATALTPGTCATIFWMVAKPSCGFRSALMSTTSGRSSPACWSADSESAH